MSTSSDASNCPGIPQCCQPDYGYNYEQSEFLSAAQTASCPMGTTGGPFAVQEAAFYSDISQADADQKAMNFMNSLIAAGCVAPPPKTFQIGTTDDTEMFSGTMTLAIDGGSPQPVSFTIHDGGQIYSEPFEASVSVVVFASIPAVTYTGSNFFELFLPTGSTGALLAGSSADITGTAIDGGGAVTCLTGTTGPNNNAVNGTFDIPTDLTGIDATSTQVNFTFPVGDTSTCTITWLLP